MVIFHDSPRAGETYSEAARRHLEPWLDFAEDYSLVLIAPVFDDLRFRADRPREENYLSFIGEYEFVDQQILAFVLSAQQHYGVERDDFLVFGSGDGGELAVRFSWMYSGLVEQAVVIAPDAYFFPNRSLEWPYGARALDVQVERSSGEIVERAIAASLPLYAIRPSLVHVIVGVEDTHYLPDLPGHRGNNRLQRAINWTAEVNSFSLENMRRPFLASLLLVNGVGHELDNLTPLARAHFSDWLESASSLSSIMDAVRNMNSESE